MEHDGCEFADGLGTLEDLGLGVLRPVGVHGDPLVRKGWKRLARGFRGSILGGGAAFRKWKGGSMADEGEGQGERLRDGRKKVKGLVALGLNQQDQGEGGGFAINIISAAARRQADRLL